MKTPKLHRRRRRRLVLWWLVAVELARENHSSRLVAACKCYAAASVQPEPTSIAWSKHRPSTRLQANLLINVASMLDPVRPGLVKIKKIFPRKDPKTASPPHTFAAKPIYKPTTIPAARWATLTEGRLRRPEKCSRPVVESWRRLGLSWGLWKLTQLVCCFFKVVALLLLFSKDLRF